MTSKPEDIMLSMVNSMQGLQDLIKNLNAIQQHLWHKIDRQMMPVVTDLLTRVQALEETAEQHTLQAQFRLETAIVKRSISLFVARVQELGIPAEEVRHAVNSLISDLAMVAQSTKTSETSGDSSEG